jgi:RecA-family ATPase
MAAIGMAIAISSGGSNWNGFAIHKHGPVAYLQIDTPRFEMKTRFRNLIDHGYDMTKIAVMDLNVAPYPFNILMPQHQTWLRQQLDVIKPVFVVIDTLREAHEGNENDSTDMKKVVNALVKVCRPAAIAFISHSRKDSAMNQMGADSDLMDEGRGSSYMSGRMDTVMKFTDKTLTMKGRSMPLTKIPIVMNPTSFLVELKDSESKLELAILRVLREHPDWTKHKQSTEVEALTGVSYKTVGRRIEKMRAGRGETGG